MKNSVVFLFAISSFAVCLMNNPVQADDGLVGGLKDLLTGDKGRRRRGGDKGLLGGLKGMRINANTQKKRQTIAHLCNYFHSIAHFAEVN